MHSCRNQAAYFKP